MENLDKFSDAVHKLSEALVDADISALETTAHADADYPVQSALELIQTKIELINSALHDEQIVIENITTYELSELKSAVDGLAYLIAQKEGGFTRYINDLITGTRPFILMKGLA